MTDKRSTITCVSMRILLLTGVVAATVFLGGCGEKTKPTADQAWSVSRMAALEDRAREGDRGDEDSRGDRHLHGVSLDPRAGRRETDDEWLPRSSMQSGR